MEELLKYLAQSLVEQPDQVSVTRVENERNIVLELRVAETDMGRVIGKQGKIAKAIRAVIKAAATKENVKVQVDIVD